MYFAEELYTDNEDGVKGEWEIEMQERKNVSITCRGSKIKF